ncbi:hypothetical protein [Lactobacillus johnsonii]|uniref:hypothetical protein n=1 Tax=Lactobacillus johnsonii TaxID=33959 RepID=UPI003D02258A
MEKFNFKNYDRKNRNYGNNDLNIDRLSRELIDTPRRSTNYGHRGMLTFRGAFKMLLDIDDEEDLKKDWEFGASSDYMPVSDEYRNWLNDPILGNIRSVALMIAVIYG